MGVDEKIKEKLFGPIIVTIFGEALEHLFEAGLLSFLLGFGLLLSNYMELG